VAQIYTNNGSRRPTRTHVHATDRRSAHKPVPEEVAAAVDAPAEKQDETSQQEHEQHEAGDQARVSYDLTVTPNGRTFDEMPYIEADFSSHDRPFSSAAPFWRFMTVIVAIGVIVAITYVVSTNVMRATMPDYSKDIVIQAGATDPAGTNVVVAQKLGQGMNAIRSIAESAFSDDTAALNSFKGAVPTIAMPNRGNIFRAPVLVTCTSSPALGGVNIQAVARNHGMSATVSNPANEPIDLLASSPTSPAMIGIAASLTKATDPATYAAYCSQVGIWTDVIPSLSSLKLPERIFTLAGYHALRGKAFLHTAQPERAEIEYTQATIDAPTVPSYYCGLGDSLTMNARSGNAADAAKAIEAYRRATALSSLAFDAWAGMARATSVLLQSNTVPSTGASWPQVAAYFSKAAVQAKLSPSDYEIWGDALANSRDYQGALSKYQFAMVGSPMSPTIHVKAARVLLFLGMKQDAMTEYRSAMADAPNDTGIKAEFLGTFAPRPAKAAKRQKPAKVAAKLAPKLQRFAEFPPNYRYHAQPRARNLRVARRRRVAPRAV